MILKNDLGEISANKGSVENVDVMEAFINNLKNFMILKK